MYRSQQPPTGDPATMSGQILLRIGIALFAVAAPCAAVVSRRTLFVLLPVAALLIIIGGLLLPGTAAQLLRHLRTALTPWSGWSPWCGKRRFGPSNESPPARPWAPRRGGLTPRRSPPPRNPCAESLQAKPKLF